MKKMLMILAALLAAALLSACGSTGAPDPEATAQEEAEVQEETALTEEADFAYPGLYLDVYDPPFGALRCLAAEVNGDGSYYRQDITEDGQLILYQKGGFGAWEDGQSPEDYLLEAATGLAETGDVSAPSIEANEEYSANLSYPVYIVSFQTGENEDLRSWKVFAMDTDSGAFLYGLSAPADTAAEMEALAEGVFSHLTLVDANAGSGAPAPDGDRTGEVAALAGTWYPNGEEGAQVFLRIDGDGNWSRYERTAGDPEAAETDGGTIVPAAGEPNAYYAESAGGESSVYFRLTPAEENDVGADVIYWDNDGGVNFLRED